MVKRTVIPKDSASIISLRAIKPLNKKQEEYLNAMENATVIFGIGPSGVGKTFLAGNWCIRKLLGKEFSKILITRPCIEAGESLGFIPGEVEDKHAPFLTPMLEVIKEGMGIGHYTGLLKAGKIEATPVAYMRGRSLEDTLLWVDESQNLTPPQVKMLLTRLGKGSKAIFDGDLRQKDIPGESGLQDAINKLKGIPEIRVIEFTKDDIVRSGIVRKILDRYED